jgi:hypothetical protein
VHPWQERSWKQEEKGIFSVYSLHVVNIQSIVFSFDCTIIKMKNVLISREGEGFLPRKFYVNTTKKYAFCLLKNFIKNSLKIEILFWLSGFFLTPQSARMQLLSGHIYLNNKKIFHSVFLKQNDVIRYVKPKLHIEKTLNFSSLFLHAVIMKVRKLTSKKFFFKKKKRKFKLKTFFFQYKKKFSLSLI